MRRRRAAVALLALAAVAGAACSGDYNRYPDAAREVESVPSTTAPTTTVPPTTVPDPGPDSATTSTTTPVEPGSTTTAPPGGPTVAPPGTDPAGRLGIVATDGALVTIGADGNGLATVAEPPPGGTVVQFAWAPDASTLAYSTTTNRVAAVGVGNAAGTTRAQPRSLATAPYYLAWNANQSAIATLRADSVDTVELASVNPALTSAPARLQSGAGISAAWSPSGTRLVAALGDSALALYSPTGTRTTLAELPAPGGAPAWVDDRHVLAAVRAGGDQRLVLLDVDTGARQDLLTYRGAIRFLPAPDGRRIAYQVGPDESDGGTGGRVSFPRPNRQTGGDPPRAEEEVLAVFEVETSQSVVVLDELAQAFQWSPSGDRLAFLDAQDDTSSRWRFWNSDPDAEAVIVDGTQFVPSAPFTELVLPIFDQLAPVTRWWSPDGGWFAFAGRVQGKEGVWVIPTATRAAPRFVHEGTLVAWSPG